MHQTDQKSSLQAQLFNSDLQSAQRKEENYKNKCFSEALNKPLIITEHIFSYLLADSER